jgi:hypothetical protein
MAIYQDRITAFIDILGFKDLVKQTTDQKDPITAQKKLDTLFDVVEYVNDYFRLSRDEIGFTQNTKVTLFSDSIVVSIDKANSIGVLEIFTALKKLQIHLIHDKILLRGGIVHGKLIHKEDMLLGPALISAYYLESSSALYPRIVIDPKVMAIYARRDGKRISKLRIKNYDYHKTFAQDFDGTCYIDYFSDIINYLNGGSVEEYINDIGSMIETNLKIFDIGIRMKYMWMKEKLKRSEYAGLMPKI